MQTNKFITAANSTHVRNRPTKSLASELRIWLDAWREYLNFQKLDADALRDMGITSEDRARTTVGDIRNRMRG
ncbi:hypothetical protein [Marivita sp. XM-24bin2]|jgi:uncharacterized protein YjiS (DUF1127 family)|uniref:hypothetical protein n=1 Tax=unclassified Marivita TaxID=2632480 RepID=UPI000D7B4F75|nr:hypothetical protein [Marivita sp. XM-24bin2]PWL35679.1 MAG: hypothetical protein DCO97_07850 [Marivita sp. XM-24bin2]